MSAAVDLDSALAALYQLPLGEFVAARDQLARQLRAAGDREVARQWRGCGARRSAPGRPARQRRPHAMAELLDAGAALQAAQQAAQQAAWPASPTPPEGCGPLVRTCGRRSPA